MSTKSSFVKGAAILGVAGLLVKIIGAVYRIPLQNIIGVAGMGNYGAVYPIYAFLLVASSAGLPTAISKLVSERLARGDEYGARRVFKTAFRLLCIIGVVSGVALALLSCPLASANNFPGSYLGFLAIAPALLFVSLLSAYRGYFQGMQRMTPTAVSQIVEQLGKLAVGFTLGASLLPLGPEYGAMGAMIGVSFSELLALVLLMGYYRRVKRDMGEIRPTHKAEPRKKVVAALLAIAIPVTLGASILPLTQSIDSFMIVSRLIGLGFAADTARAAFAVLTQSVYPLINMPAVLSLAIAMSLVPAISQAVTQKRAKDVRDMAGTGLKITILIGMPASVGMFCLAEQILRMLYSSLTPEQLALGTQLLQTMSVAVMMLALVQSMTGILQGMGRQMIPVVNLFFGAIIKVVVSFILLGIPSINIVGASVGTIACYTFAAAMNIIYVLRRTGLRPRLLDFIVKPLLASALMAAGILVLYPIFITMAGGSNTIATLLSVVFAVVIYFSTILLTKTLNAADLELIPGGSKLQRLTKQADLE